MKGKQQKSNHDVFTIVIIQPQLIVPAGCIVLSGFLGAKPVTKFNDNRVISELRSQKQEHYLPIRYYLSF